MRVAVITIRLGPFIHLGPLTIAWHGLTIAIGILIGSVVAGRWARERGVDGDPLFTIVGLVAVGGLVGGRVFYLLEHDPGGLVHPSTLLSSNGFTFDGGVILAVLFIAAYVVRRGLSLSYLDAVAAGLPLGVAIGRIGDVINGEHYGARSDLFLAVRNANPDALTPNPNFAYQSGGLYEVLLAAGIFALVWPLRHRFRTQTSLVWLVLILFAGGRFFEFYLRSDSPELALGLSNAQWTSLAILVVSSISWVYTARRSRVRESALLGTASLDEPLRLGGEQSRTVE